MFRKILANFGVRIAAAVLNLILAILFSQILGPAGKGEQSLFLTTIAIIIIFDGFIGGAALVYLASRISWRRLLIAANLWIMVISILTYISLQYIFLFSYSQAFHLSLLSAISAVTSVNASLLLGKQHLKAFNSIQLSVPLFTLVAASFQVLVWDHIYYQQALYFAYMIALLLSIYYLVIHWPKFEPKESWLAIWKQLFELGFMNQLAHVLQLLSFRLTFYLLNANGQGAAVGLMSNASSITESIWLVASSISLWQYAAISNSNDSQYNQQITEKLARFGMFVSFILLIVFLILPSKFYGFVFGESFENMRILMFVLAPGVWIFTYALIVGHYFSGIGKYWVNALASGIGLLVCYIFSRQLISNFYSVGAAAAMSASYVMTSLVVAYFFKRSGGKLFVFPTYIEIKVVIDRLKHSFKSHVNV